VFLMRPSVPMAPFYLHAHATPAKEFFSSHRGVEPFWLTAALRDYGLRFFLSVRSGRLLFFTRRVSMRAVSVFEEGRRFGLFR